MEFLMKSTKHKRDGRMIKTINILVLIKMKSENEGVKLWIQSQLGQHGFNPIGMI